MMGNSAQRNEDEEDIKPGRKEKVAVACNPTRLAVSGDERQNTLGKRDVFTRGLWAADAVVAAGTVGGEETGMLRGGHYDRRE